jgi:hypothetical protein
MTTRALDKLRSLGLAVGSAMVAHQVVVIRADRLAHHRRVRAALLRSRPSR